MNRNVLFITVDQWRGDCLSAGGHPVLETPALDRLAAQGTRFANHWANAAPCGPSRACLYTGTYLHHNRSLHNGTPLDARFTNVALLARQAGYDPVLFGYTDTSVDPRTVPADDPRLTTYEGVLPGFRPVVHDPWEAGSRQWGRWLAARGVDVPSEPRRLYEPIEHYPADAHGATWAPTQFGPELSETAFLVEAVTGWLDRHGDEPFFLHASFIGPHPPRRNPVGYHDRYAADDLPAFVGATTREEEAAAHPLNGVVMRLPVSAAPDDERDRRQVRALALGALDGARALDVLKASPEDRDPVAGEPAVGLDLGLAGTPGPDTTTKTLEVAPQSAHACKVVLELGELDLELALGASGVRREDVEYHRRAVHHGEPDGSLQVALLASGELVVACDQVRVELQCGGLRLGDLAGPEVGVRVWLLAVLHQLADDADPRRAQQLGELGEVISLGQRRDAQRALARTLSGLLRAVRGRGLTLSELSLAVMAALHPTPSLGAGTTYSSDAQPPRAPSRPTASRRRSSGVVSEIRNQPSPAGP